MNNQYSGINPDFRMLIREISRYGRAVTEINCNKKGEFVFYVNPPYNGTETIVIQDMRNPKKFIEYALQTIRKIPEFEKINDKNWDAKARLLAEFRNKYVPSKKTGLLGKIYHRKPREISDDFYEIFEDLITISASNSVSPKQFQTLIKMYERKTPDEIIILPSVGKYGEVNLTDIKIVPKSVYRHVKSSIRLPAVSKSPKSSFSVPKGLSTRQDLARDVLMVDTNLTEESDRLEAESHLFYSELIHNLEERWVFAQGVKVDPLEIERLEKEDLNGA